MQAIKVPLTYANKDKMLAEIKQDPVHDRETAITLPRMSFSYHAPDYDGARKLNTIHRTVKKHETDVNSFRYQYTEVPYNFNFSLYIYVNSAEDAAKIVEQILPYFTPAWSATIQLIPEFDVIKDVEIVKGNITSEDTFEGVLTDRRTIVWTIPFVLKGHLFGPIKKAPIIKFANTRFFIGTGSSNNIGPTSTLDANGYNTTIGDSVVVSPGLDANGDPTTVPSGLVEAAAIVGGGSGYSVADTLTVVGGTGTSANLSVLEVSSGVITVISVKNTSDYSVNPTNPVSVTGGTGSGATFNLTLSGTIDPLLVDVDDDWGYVVEKSGITVTFE